VYIISSLRQQFTKENYQIFICGQLYGIDFEKQAVTVNFAPIFKNK